MNNLVSIIIVNYNGKKWLKKLFDSLLSQTFVHFEIIFVENGSTDDSLEFIINNYKDDRIRIVKSEKNLGFAGGNNLGIAQSQGEYIFLLNSDTWIEEDFLERILKTFKFNKCDILGITETPYEKFKNRYYRILIDLFGHQVVIKEKNKNAEPFYISGACLFFKKDLYLETGGLDNDFFMYCEEVDWFWRLHLQKKKIFQSSDIFLHHAGSGSFEKRIKDRTFLWRNQNTLQMLLKNYAWYNLIWVLPIYFIQNIFEMTFFLLLLKPKISLSYAQGWWFNIINLRKIMQKRRCVQKNRKVGDWEIIKKMYWGFGKLHHLISFYSK